MYLCLCNLNNQNLLQIFYSFTEFRRLLKLKSKRVKPTWRRGLSSWDSVCDGASAAHLQSVLFYLRLRFIASNRICVLVIGHSTCGRGGGQYNITQSDTKQHNRYWTSVSHLGTEIALCIRGMLNTISRTKCPLSHFVFLVSGGKALAGIC